MNIIELMERFNSQQACIDHLELLRFNGKPYCPLCEGYKVARKIEKNRKGRWNCYDCCSSFNVLSGTIFEKTRTPLIKWFLAIAIVINAKKGISSHQLSRHLGMTQDSALRMLNKIREEMLNEMVGIQLSGIVEADETYANIRIFEDCKRGRGANKLKILGAVERGGNVIARRVQDVTGDTMKWFMLTYLDRSENTLLITDQFSSYSRMHEIVNHKYMRNKKYRGINTSIIEGFWNIYKRTLYGTHYRYDDENTDYYLAEVCFRYNNRHYQDSETFDYFIKQCVFKHSNKAYHLIEGNFFINTADKREAA